MQLNNIRINFFNNTIYYEKNNIYSTKSLLNLMQIKIYIVHEL